MSEIDFFSILEKEKKPKAEDVDFFSRLEGLETTVDMPVQAVGEPGLDDLGMRWDLGRASTYPEQLAAFKRKYPEGDLVFKSFPQDDESSLAFRKAPTDAWSKVDPGWFEKHDAGEIIGDLVDFVGEDGYEILGEIISSRGAASLPKLAARIAGGNIAGSAVGELEQSLKGIQLEPYDDMAYRIGGKTALSTGIGAGSELLIRKSLAPIMNTLRGRGLFKQTPEGSLATQSASDLGVRGIPSIFVTTHPWLEKLGQQSRALVPRIDDYVREARAQNTSIIDSLQQNLGADNWQNALLTNEQAYRTRILRQLEESLGVSGSKVSEVGDRLKTNISDYDKLAKANVDELYTAARGIDEPIFNLSKLRSTARQLLEADKGALRTADVARPGAITDEFGRPYQTTATVDRGPASRESLDANVRSVLNEIMETEAMAPRVSGDIVITPLDQLNQWAERIGIYTQPGSDQISKLTQSTASKLYSSLRDSLDNPQNINTSPGFSESWKAARTAAHNRFDTLSKVATARSTMEPISYIRSVYGPQNADKLRNLKNSLTKEGFKDVKQGYMAYLFETKQIKNLSQTLKEMTPEFRAELFTRRELQELTRMGEAVDQLNKLNVPGRVRKQTRITGFIDDIMTDPSTANIDKFMSMIKSGGGMEGSLGRNFRAGLLEHLMNRSMVTVGQGDMAVRTLDSTRLDKELTEWTRLGLDKMLPKKDVDVLYNVANVERAYQTGADPGTSIVAGSTVSGLRGIRPIKTFFSFMELMGANLLSKFLVSGIGRRVLSGTGQTKQWGTMPGIALTASAITKLVRDEKAQEKREEQW